MMEFNGDIVRAPDEATPESGKGESQRHPGPLAVLEKAHEECQRPL
jgi:hypothetical protein